MTTIFMVYPPLLTTGDLQMASNATEENIWASTRAHNTNPNLEASPLNTPLAVPLTTSSTSGAKRGCRAFVPDAGKMFRCGISAGHMRASGVPVGNLIRLAREAESRDASVFTREAYSLVWSVLVSLFRSRVSLEAGVLILRHRLNIQRRHLPKRLAFSAMDRLILVGLYRLVPNTIRALTIVTPETVIRWHRAGFRSYWRWKSRPGADRATVPAEIRRLIREMSIANALWGAPRIHGELLKLCIEIGQTSVAKYTARRRGPPSPRLEDLPPPSCRRHRGVPFGGFMAC
jgi:hypothetical protein